MAAMKLLTKEIAEKFRTLGRQEKKGTAAEIVVKYFHPMSSWTWYATEAYLVTPEGEEVNFSDITGDIPLEIAHDVIFFGMVHGHEKELGYFSLNELAGVKVRGLGIERDLYMSAGKTLEDLEQGGHI